MKRLSHAQQQHQQRQRLPSFRSAILGVMAICAGVLLWQSAAYIMTRPLPQCQHAMRDRLAQYSRAALAADWASKVRFSPATPIPTQQMWQTTSSKQLTEDAQELHDTWRKKNPRLNLTLMDDGEAAAFIQEFYGAEVAKVYELYPVAVMRADFWRLAILYARGGIYGDIDTRCLKPIVKWMPPRKPRPSDPVFVSNTSWTAPGPLQYHNLTWDDCSLVAAVENNVHMCNWLIAAAPGHPIVRAALSIALRSVEDGFDCGYEHMVHEHTGPAVWTRAFGDVLGLGQDATAAQISKAAWTDPAVYKRARALKVCVVAYTFFGSRWAGKANTTAQNAENLYSSTWEDGPNKSWLKEREKVTAAVKRWGRGRQGGAAGSRRLWRALL